VRRSLLNRHCSVSLCHVCSSKHILQFDPSCRVVPPGAIMPPRPDDDCRRRRYRLLTQEEAQERLSKDRNCNRIRGSIAACKRFRDLV
jgi:hypothetical protein